MSLIRSFYEPLKSNDAVFDSFGQDKQKIQEVIRTLLSTHPELLTTVDRGEVNQKVLEVEIVKVFDQQGVQHNRQQMIDSVFNEMFGYGQLQNYIEDEDITDIIGTRHDCFFAKRNGRVEAMSMTFESKEAFETFCKLIVIRNGGVLNENDNHARVGDETNRLRINVTIPPRAVGGPLLNIRKHRKNALDLEDLESLGMLSKIECELMRKLAQSDKRILISGKGASGKTTLLRAILNEIGGSSRILVCESDVELYPDSPTIVSQRMIQRNGFGKSVTLEELIKDGLTMSLDGYCIGEITGIEAWTFIKAGYTDHRTFATLHSNSAEEVVQRLLMLSQMTQLGHSENQAKVMICGAIDFVLQLQDFKLAEIFYVQRFDINENVVVGRILTAEEALCLLI